MAVRGIHSYVCILRAIQLLSNILIVIIGHFFKVNCCLDEFQSNLLGIL